MMIHTLVRREWWRGVGIGLGALALLAGCGQRETQVQQATREGIMLVGNGAEPQDLDPHTITGIPERNVVITLFEGLTRNDPETLEARPGVAERWDISPDGLVYTFHLRSNVKWSDGTPLTARDFYESFRRQLTPSLASDNADNMYDVVNAEAYHKGQITDFSQVGFRLIDERTLEVRLMHPAGFLLKTMASRSWFPVPLHVLAKHGDPYRQGNRWTRPENIVGNGPFVMSEWEPNRHIAVKKSPTYWNRDAVKLEGVRFIPIESLASEEAAFRAGQLHKTEQVPLTKIAVYQAEEPDRIHIHPFSGVYFFNFNVKRAPFTDKRVRQALALAVDRESLIRNVTKGGELPAYHFTPEGIGGYVSRARTRLDYDEARRLLAEAGFPGGKGLPPIRLLYNTAENHRVIAEALQQSWKRELGVELILENQEWKVYLDTVDNGDYMLSRQGLIVEPYDPSLFLKAFTSYGGFNRTGWGNAEYDRLYTEVMATSEDAKRLELMQQMEAILTDEMPILPVYYYTSKYLMDPSVRGWKNNLMAMGPFEQVWLQ